MTTTTIDLDDLMEAIREAVTRVFEASNMERAHPPVQGWTPARARMLGARLRDRGRADRAEVIQALAANGGQIDRTRVAEICGYGPDRKISGFTKPVKGVIRQMIAEGLLPANVADPLQPRYPSGEISKATGFTMPPEVAEVFVAANTA